MDLVGHAGTGGAGAVDDQALVGEALAGDLHAGDHCGDDDRAGALHVIVEDAVLLAVGQQDAARVGRAEVLEVEQRVGEELGRDGQVLVDECVVLLAAHACVTVAQVCGVVEQGLVVRAAVQVDGDCPLGVDAGGRRVDGELAYGDIGAVDAPVPDPEDLLGIGGDQQIDVVGPQTQALQGGAHVLDTVHGQVDGARPAVVAAPLLDGLADRGVVDDRQQLGEVVGEHPVVEDLVAVVELVEEDVLVQVRGLGGQLCVSSRGLLVQGLDGGGEATDEPEPTPLLLGEGGAAVGQWVGDDGWLGQHVVSSEWMERVVSLVTMLLSSDSKLTLVLRGRPSMLVQWRVGRGGARQSRYR